MTIYTRATLPLVEHCTSANFPSDNKPRSPEVWTVNEYPGILLAPIQRSATLGTAGCMRSAANVRTSVVRLSG
jgi:hypothetical protein